MIDGLKACYLNYEEQHIEITERKIIRNFARLPQSTANVALYNEFGIMPIVEEIKNE